MTTTNITALFSEDLQRIIHNNLYFCQIEVPVNLQTRSGFELLVNRAAQ